MTVFVAEYDIVVIGGGLVGAAIAYGLAQREQRVALLDEGDVAFRASRGNFGLVWVQGKGLNSSPYAAWTRLSSDLWPGFAEELERLTGTALAYQRRGGLMLCLSESELNERRDSLAALSAQLQGRYEYEILGNNALRRQLPEVSTQVAGASFCPHDGHVNPLYLLRALHGGCQRLGGDYLAVGPVDQIQQRHSGFEISAGSTQLSAGKVVLAAGLGNRKLAPMLGLEAPVEPQRGQIMITERVRPFLDLPTLHLRQTAEGGLQIGDSHEDVGFDEGTRRSVLSTIAQRAVTAFPFLKQVHVVRTWGALRVMTPDGIPIYDASERCPGAFLANCHSGVTLAAAHAGPLAGWIAGHADKPAIEAFTAERFHVSTAA